MAKAEIRIKILRRKKGLYYVTNIYLREKEPDSTFTFQSKLRGSGKHSEK